MSYGLRYADSMTRRATQRAQASILSARLATSLCLAAVAAACAAGDRFEVGETLWIEDGEVRVPTEQELLRGFRNDVIYKFTVGITQGDEELYANAFCEMSPETAIAVVQRNTQLPEDDQYGRRSIEDRHIDRADAEAVDVSVAEGIATVTFVYNSPEAQPDLCLEEVLVEPQSLRKYVAP